MYIFHRNANVEDYQKVLTPDHIRHLMSSSTGVKTEKKAAHEKGAPVTFTPSSGESNAKNEANVILARQSEGYVATIVSGEVIMQDGQPTGALPGKLIRRSQLQDLQAAE